MRSWNENEEESDASIKKYKQFLWKNKIKFDSDIKKQKYIGYKVK